MWRQSGGTECKVRRWCGNLVIIHKKWKRQRQGEEEHVKEQSQKEMGRTEEIGRSGEEQVREGNEKGKRQWGRARVHSGNVAFRELGVRA